MGITVLVFEPSASAGSASKEESNHFFKMSFELCIYVATSRQACGGGSGNFLLMQNTCAYGRRIVNNSINSSDPPHQREFGRK